MEISMRRKIVTLLLILGFLTSSSVLSCLPVQAKSRTILVPDDYPTISAAIANAVDGDTVFVKKGTYEEHSLIINRLITLVGEEAESTVIRNIDNPSWDPSLQPFPPPSPVAVRIKAANTKITNLTITGIYASYIPIGVDADRTQIARTIIEPKGDGISIKGNNNAFMQNRISGIGNGFISCDGSNNTIANNLLIGTTEATGSILSVNSSNLVYNNTILEGYIEINGNENLIAKNSMKGGTGVSIYIEKGSNNSIIANRITDGSGLGVGRGYGNTFSANEIVRNNIGIIIGGSQTANNTFYHNNFIDNTYQVWTGNEAHGTEYFDNGKEGNYWSDYSGFDANGDGIGDTPKQVYASYYGDQDVLSTILLGQDNFPLMTPFDIDNVTVQLPDWVILSLNSEPETNESESSEPIPALPVAAASVATAIVVGVGLLVYFRKRRH
jgi:nitrous oxidase accessory protein